MAKKKENFKDMGKSELEKRLTVLRDDLRSIAFKGEGARPKNVKEPQAIKKNIARILTELSAQNQLSVQKLSA